MYDPQNRAAPTVSVIMPVHDAAEFVAAAVESVQMQSFQDWELIAVDDGSSDASARILADMAERDRRIVVLCMGGNNHGAGLARNAAMDRAQGRYIAFLDADDLWNSRKLDLHLAFLCANPVGLSFTAYLREDVASGRIEPIGVPPSVRYEQLLTTNIIGCSTVLLDRRLLGEPRMPALRRRQDFALWLQILRQTGPALGLPVALTTYRRRTDSVSGSKATAARATWALYRGHLKLSFWRTCQCFVRYSWRGVLRHRAPGLARALGYLRPAILPDTAALSLDATLAVQATQLAAQLTIAIATTQARLSRLDLSKLPRYPDTIYEIFVQVSQRLGALHSHPARPDIRITPVEGEGVARNRNNALALVTTPLLLFADDDLHFDPCLAALPARFAAEPELDFLCAQLRDKTGQPRKRYSTDGTVVRWFNCAKVGTPEIALRPARFRAAGVRFDQGFGAGTKDWLGDEYIFICDALRVGLQGRHVAIFTATHSEESSGLRKGAEAMSIRKRVLIRALGRWKSHPARWAFAFRHRRDFPDLASFLRFL